MTAAVDIAPARLDLGRVIRRTFEVLGRNPLLYFGLAFLFGALPGLLPSVLLGRADAVTLARSPLYYLALLIMLLFSSFLGATIYDLAIADHRGAPRPPREAFANGLKLFLPLFAVNLLLWLAFAVGVLLLIVPGFMILTAWYVAGPALIDERTGITQSLGRSAQLTRNNRWGIFGLLVLFFFLAIIIEAIVGALGLAAGLAGGAMGVFTAPQMIGTAIINTLFAAVSLVGAAVLYAELRELKEGAGSFSEVFD
jgi:hypothetical protein